MKVLTRTTITIDRPVQVVWDYITDPDNLPKYLVGYGPIPRAKKVEVYEGQPMTPGAKQRTTTTDGRVVEEQILQVRKHEYFDYQLISGFGFPFDLIVRTGGGAWTFAHENNTASIIWDYYFELTSPLMYPLGALMVKFFYRNAMNAALEEAKRQLDDKINLMVVDKRKETLTDSLMGFKKTLLKRLPIITLLAIYILLGGIALFTYLNVSRTLLQCRELEQEIDTFIKQASYCEADEECVVSQKATYPVCGCPNLINENISVSQIVKKKGEWGEKGCGQIQDLPTCVPCASVPNRAICQENRCVWNLWQIYRNKEFGFEFQYPATYKVDRDSQKLLQLMLSSQSFIDMEVISTEKSKDEYINDYIEAGKTGFEGKPSLGVHGRLDVLVSSRSATQLEVSYPAIPAAGVVTYIELADGSLIRFGITDWSDSQDIRKVYDQILATFRFVK